MSEIRDAFADAPTYARGHLGVLFFHAAAFHLIYHLRCRAAAADHPLEDVLDEHPFLASYFGQIRNRLPDEIDWDQSLQWLRDQILEWEQAAPAQLPLVAMRETLNSDYTGTLAFILTGMVEEQTEFSALFARLQHPQGEHRASLGFIQQVLENEETPETWLFVRPLVESGFVQVMNRDIPRSEWILCVPTVLWNAVRGECTAAPLEGVRYHALQLLEPLSDLLIDEKLRDQLSELSSLACSSRIRTIIVRGMPGTDRLGAIGAIARALGRGVIEIKYSAAHGNDERWRSIGPLCTLSHCIPVFSVEAGPGGNIRTAFPGGIQRSDRRDDRARGRRRRSGRSARRHHSSRSRIASKPAGVVEARTERTLT